jgi:hypothetical protein
MEREDSMEHGPLKALLDAIEGMETIDESDYEIGELVEQTGLNIDERIDPDAGSAVEFLVHIERN